MQYHGVFDIIFIPHFEFCEFLMVFCIAIGFDGKMDYENQPYSISARVVNISAIL